jgi:CRISPR-associated protein Csb2
MEALAMSLVKPREHFGNNVGQIVRFAFSGRLPDILSTVAVAEAFRSAVLSALHAVTGSKNSFLLSGHQPDGRPDDQHRHAYYLPQPNSEGRLAEMLVVSPRSRFSEDETTAFSVVKRLQWNGTSATLGVELIADDDLSAQQLATGWESITPYVPPRRFWGTSGKRHLTPERQLATELCDSVQPLEIRISLIEKWTHLRVRVVFNDQLAGDLQRRVRFGFRIAFYSDPPIVGPITLGHSAHFGMGQFRPLGSIGGTS